MSDQTTEDKKFRCKYSRCSYTGATRARVRLHQVAIHEKCINAICCGERFPTKWDYVQHRDNHHANVGRYKKIGYCKVTKSEDQVPYANQMSSSFARRTYSSRLQQVELVELSKDEEVNEPLDLRVPKKCEANHCINEPLNLTTKKTWRPWAHQNP